MIKKISIIPSADKNLFEDSRIDEINRANAQESLESAAKVSRSGAKLILKNPPSSDTIRSGLALQMHFALSQLASQFTDLESAIDIDLIREKTPWSDLKAVLAQVRDLLSPLPSSSSRKLPKSLMNPKQLELPFGSVAFPKAVDFSNAYDDFMELMDYPKGTYYLLSDLIDKGASLEKYRHDHPHGPKLGRDPFEP
jgi:hypothetical protein